MATVVERTEGHYEVQELEFGRVYRWCPERVVAVCGCGERVDLSEAASACGRCGADLDAVWREGRSGEQPGDEVLRPWQYEGSREGVGLPC